jgi:alkanesulfonate monooxygenase SsuD/methylene tetrahydromethanopterin reductase-like flavin-dependent oxidoreductase (luciferase family)
LEIGIGLPNTVAGATGASLLEWARRAERAGFYGLSTIGAVSYPGYEELIALAAAAAVTERIRLFPDVVLGPTRSAAELAKQAATVDQISGGRLTLGLAVGWREADYRLTGRDFPSRGRAFEQQLRDVRTAWRGEPMLEGTREVAPPLMQQDGVPILLGGLSEATFRRAADFADGWTAGGSPPEVTAQAVQRMRAAWEAAGRDGAPRIAQLVYFSLGGTEQASRSYLLDYYEPFGDDVAEMIAGSARRSPDAIHVAVQAYRDVGVDELYFDPTVADPSQVDLLAEVVL